MKAPRVAPRGAVSVPGGEVWFISLGDLLTLLVCFFLLLTPQGITKVGGTYTKQAVSTNGGARVDLGTELASLPLNRPSSLTELRPIWRDLLAGADRVQRQHEARTSWLLELRSGLKRGDGVMVKLCDRSVEEAVIGDVMKEVQRQTGAEGRVQFELDSECGPQKEQLASPADLAALMIFSGR